jgi:L-histidine Nalpha-methyltransferase
MRAGSLRGYGLPETTDPQFRKDVLAGLSESIPAIPARWLYDRRGSELFDEITRLPSYYPTRTETDLLGRILPKLATAIPQGMAVIEFGAGSATKTPPLLEAIDPAAYVPVDISGDHLESSAAGLREQFPDLPICPVSADFTRRFPLPAMAQLRRLGFFPGSTIGNFVPRSATDLLRHFRELLGTGSLLLIGMDSVKPVERLIAAYDEPKGVTARFNFNLLERINRELGGTIPLDAFRHEARWNDILSRVEMHLVATRDVDFAIEDQEFSLKRGTIDPHREQPQVRSAGRSPFAARRRLDSGCGMGGRGRGLPDHPRRGATEPLRSLIAMRERCG